METENVPSSNENSKHEDSEPEDSEGQSNSKEREINKERIFLASRRTKKHVTIQEDSPFNSQALVNVEDAVQNLEKNFAAGIYELRHSLSAISSDRKGFELHIKSLEESLRKSMQEKERYKEIVDQMRGDMEILSTKLDAMEKFNEDLQGKHDTLQSDHEDHMRTIADKHRTTRLAKKTFSKWKGKLKHKELSNIQIEKLLEENAKLKKELLRYQESTKNAFLRSANVLNSEALSLFQNTTKRFVHIPTTYNDSDDNENQSTDTSSISDKSSIASVDEFQSRKGKENERRFHHRFKEPFSNSFKEGMKTNITHHSDDAQREGPRKYSTQVERSHSDNELPTGRKRVIEDFVPDPLRRETRQIMKQLETNKETFFNLNAEKKGKICTSNNTHIHICHCARAPMKGENYCPYCFANQNFKFANIPICNKNKAKDKKKVVHNINPSEHLRFTADKAKVLYKPSGSTVLIEKHL